jgi:hypothetical protein
MPIVLDGTTGSSQPAVILTGSVSGTVTIAAPATAGTQSYTLPTGVPAANGYSLTSTTGGVMSWANITTTPGGSDTQVQFNDGGSTFGGDAGLTYNKTTDDLTILGNLVIGTSGKGIDFSATPSTGTSELFADYEEGTWTPTCSNGSTYTGVYTKIGRIVHLFYNSSSGGTITAGSTTLTGIPFSPSGTIGSGTYVNATSTTAFGGTQLSSTTLYFATASTGPNISGYHCYYV